MRILITNDDGIHAPGLKAAEKIAHALSDDVWVVAPETEQSGASHSLTISAPLRLRRIEDKRFAVSGTPTDCVMMAVGEIMKDGRPDLILSGVNRGANIADDVTYSGTIAGAMEGCALEIPAIALSQAYGFDEKREVPWNCGEVHGPTVIAKLVDAKWPDDVLMNVNFPDCQPGDIKGVEVTVQGKRDMQASTFDRRMDMRGNPYYWIGFRRVRGNPKPGTDLAAIHANRISVTPLHLNLTEFRERERLKDLFARDE
jgi:5'/3'-nucleotidase SurE